MSILLGSHVKIGTKKGTVRFIGETEFASGTWYGVELEMAVGKNNGSVNGKSYFVCDDQKGLFVKKSQIRLDRSATKATGSKASSSSHSNTPKSTPRHATTASHDHKTTHQTALTSQKKTPSTKTSAANTPVNPPRSLGSPDKDFQIGDTVKVGTKRGTIRFVGETKFAAGAWYGVELEHPMEIMAALARYILNANPIMGFSLKPQLRRSHKGHVCKTKPSFTFETVATQRLFQDRQHQHLFYRQHQTIHQMPHLLYAAPLPPAYIWPPTSTENFPPHEPGH